MFGAWILVLAGMAMGFAVACLISLWADWVQAEREEKRRVAARLDALRRRLESSWRESE